MCPQIQTNVKNKGKTMFPGEELIETVSTEVTGQCRDPIGKQGRRTALQTRASCPMLPANPGSTQLAFSWKAVFPR